MPLLFLMIQDYNRECQSVAANNNQQQHNNIIKKRRKPKNAISRNLSEKLQGKKSILAPFFKFLEVVFDLLVPVVIAQIIDVGITGNDRPYIIERFFILVLMQLPDSQSASPHFAMTKA